jgi:hypothetical protein
VLRSQVPHQVFRSFPLRCVIKGMRFIVFLKDSTIHTSGLDPSRPNPGCQGAPNLFARCRTNHNAQVLDDQVEYLAESAPGNGSRMANARSLALECSNKQEDHRTWNWSWEDIRLETAVSCAV